MMNRYIVLTIAGLGLTFSSCVKEKMLVVTNPINMERNDEVVVLDRQTVEASFPVSNGGLLPAVKAGDSFVPSQIDDLNGDGEWDELAFMVNLKPNEELSLNIVYVEPYQYPEFEKRTNLRLGIIQPDGSFKEVDYYAAPPWTDGFKIIAQGEGVTWENDKMGFRVYFDCRNVKDLFGKLKPGLIADKVHTSAMGSYHDLADWGMDVLHCGSSLGSGGLAILGQDSLYRLGTTDTYEYRKITEGPVRSVCDLIYGGWNVAGENLSAVERVSIYPGKYWFQSDVTVSGFEGHKELVTGIVTSLLKSDPYHFKANAGYDVIATLDKQSLNNDTLGMAVMLKLDEVTKVNRSTDINFFERGYKTVPEKKFSNVVSETYYVAQKIKNDNPARHYFFAVWGLENPKWNDINELKNYTSQEAEKLSNPLVVKFL